MTRTQNEQELFWKGSFGSQYVSRNDNYKLELEQNGWRRMLNSIDKSSIHSVLECGCNTGRNLVALKDVLPNASQSLIEINPDSYQIAVERCTPKHAFNGPILESDFQASSFDLTFTCGVLIHIVPDDLQATMEKLYTYSNRYILFSEYFSHTPEMKPYHGHDNKLFKRDFGRFFLEHFDARVVEYGFLWDLEFESRFDDMNWWLFEKTPASL